MLILLISFLIPAVLNIWVQKKHSDYFDWSSLWFVSTLCGLLIFLVLQIATGIPNRQWDEVRSGYNIVAMKTGDRISADITHGLFYFREKVDDEEYYFVMTKKGDTYKQDKVKCDETVIVETAGKPRLTKKKTYYIGAAGISNWIRFNLAERTCVGESDTLYVPEGTIDSNVKWEVF